MIDHLKQLTTYNVWANQHFGALLSGLPTEMLDAETPSSFPSLRKTVNHIWDAEKIWLNRMQGISVDYWPSSKLSAETPIAAFVEESKAYKAFIHQQSEEYLLGNQDFTNTKGTTYSTPIAGIVMHTMNHSTFHRGQLVTMLRALGHAQIPQTDFIWYLREISGQ